MNDKPEVYISDIRSMKDAIQDMSIHIFRSASLKDKLIIAEGDNPQALNNYAITTRMHDLSEKSYTAHLESYTFANLYDKIEIMGLYDTLSMYKELYSLIDESYPVVYIDVDMRVHAL